jgi:hypothetical protein
MILTSATINLITNFSYEIAIKTVCNSLSSFNYIYTYLTNNNNTYVQKYLDDIDTMDVKVKIEFINNWLCEQSIYEDKQIEDDVIFINKKIFSTKSDNFNLVFLKIKEISIIINHNIQKIENKIINYTNGWTSYFYNLNLSNEICILEKNIKILDNRIKLLNLIKN